MAQVTIKSLTKKFGEVVAVDAIDLTIGESEFVALVGPSGCGKTTTLRMVAGLESITSGEIYIGDTLVNDLPPKDRDIAMVFQNYALYPHMTVYENMTFGLVLRGKDKKYIKSQVEWAAKILDIEDLLKRRPRELSGGQRQRVALGRSIVREPQVFLMDEPLSNLDAKLRVQMRAEISRLHNRLKTTTIYVTHDQIEAMTMASHIVVMKDGVIQQIDTPLSIYRNPSNKFVAGFIGSPPMNFFEGEIMEEGDKLWFVNEDMKFPVSPNHYKAMVDGEKAVSLGVRPDLISLDIENDNVTLGNFKAEVDVVEPLGSENLIYFKTKNNSSLIAKVPPIKIVKPGEVVTLQIPMEKVHYFSQKTDDSIIADCISPKR